tara:strand:- start:33 stop:290 length:258 start_codon:yes stop_codon:yes gene_type:complete
MKYLSYLFYLIAILAALSAGFQILNQMFPDYGIFHLIVGFIGTAMFFPLVPIYPAINNGEWIYLITCYLSILLGVILNNRSRTTK